MNYEDNHIRLFDKDCRFMAELPDESVQCVVTSPPYWGLRKYSGEQELIWGDKDCEHQWGDKKVTRKGHPGTKSTLVGTQTAELSKAADTFGSTCGLCGAFKCGYGLEPTPEMYIEHTIEILREIRRVLRKDGVVFWNIGDSYSGGNRVTDKVQSLAQGNVRDLPIEARPSRMMGNHSSIKPKDLCLIPFRVAIAAQEDGWWVRSVIIWSKPNPMPESVTDRPTESHEYILLLTKSKKYYWDADAVRLPAKPNADGKVSVRPSGDSRTRDRDNWGVPHETKQVTRVYEQICGPNIRSVWEFPTQPYPQAHFAVFPEKLPEICIKAATPEVGCCSKCGAPWSRVIKKGFTDHSGETKSTYPEGTTAKRLAKLRQAAQDEGKEYQNTSETVGWQPTCKCNADKVPSIVLDPFAGAGTTLWVAKKLNRQAVGYEISQEYCKLALDRCRQQVLPIIRPNGSR